jgi:hypothetical protein
MRKIIKGILTMLFIFTCSSVFITKAYAIDDNAYKTVTNRNIIYVVENNGSLSYSWQFDKEQYKDNINFSLNISNNSPSIYTISKKIDTDIKRKYLFFEHHGTLPTTALMKVKVSDEFKDGDKLYLYYYNDQTDKLEYINHNLTVKNGFVEFKIEHCSDYILTASIVKKAIDNPQSMAIFIITLIVLGVVLVAATLFMNSKK